MNHLRWFTRKEYEMSGIAVVGLGSIGAPIARNLLSAGYEVAVWNRSQAPVQALVDAGARAVAAPAEALRADIVLSVLANDDAVTEVFLRDEVLAAARPGTIHINMATVSPTLTRTAAEAHARHGVGYVAAPVFGAVPVAEAGKLNILAAGPAELIEAAQPVFDVIGARTWRLGDDPVRSIIVKIAGNLLIASAIQTLSEAISLTERAGLDAADVAEVLTSTIVPGPVYSGYADRIVRDAYEPAGFSTVLGLKDVNLARAAAADTGLDLPIGNLLRTLLQDNVDAGLGRHDWAALAATQRRRDLPPSATGQGA
ncbi:NAD(P)-dependent oxidoreductase [Nonomuraea sp. NPDC000554]|uniref:NAD(P)-dependent oxidoreductase n=1 Tax=Nonomuraea sp. NPDC000554 TaxID=3154259 RepID=UPI00331DA132